MCNGTTLEEWQVRCIEHLLRIGNTRAVLLIVDDAVASSSPFQTLKRAAKKTSSRRVMFDVYDRFFSRSRAARRVNIAQFLSRATILRCRTVRVGRYSGYFTEEDVQTIRKFNLDFIIRFAFGIIRGEILRAARYGVWSFHHDDEEKYRGTPPGFWEIYNGDNVTGAMLQRLTDRLDAGVVLKRGFLKTIHYSYPRNRDSISYESARWPAQVCVDIRNGSAAYLNGVPSRTNGPIMRSPSNVQMIIFSLKVFRNAAIRIFRFLFCHEMWNIGIIASPITAFLNPKVKTRIRWLPQTRSNWFLSDPFGIFKDDKLTILCEDFDYRTSRGIISSVESAQTARPLIRPAIVLPVHTSYPYLIMFEGEIYCIPETANAREVALFKAVEFPNRWVRVSLLISDFAGVDCTVFRHNGSWWLFCVSLDRGDHALYVWHAKNLVGPWRPHSSNPVKIDIRSARPAGTPFIHKGYLIRPAQDCSRAYGGSIVLNRVTRLTTTEFREEPIARVEADPEGSFPDGLHTLSAVRGFTLIDGKRFGFSLTALWHSAARLRFDTSTQYIHEEAFGMTKQFLEHSH
ncbi:MAG: hypothetical protein WB661_12670 [Candidatus Bathyarchaeia archaeon]